jgi:hypothetical protein
MGHTALLPVDIACVLSDIVLQLSSACEGLQVFGWSMPDQGPTWDFPPHKLTVWQILIEYSHLHVYPKLFTVLQGDFYVNLHGLYSQFRKENNINTSFWQFIYCPSWIPWIYIISCYKHLFWECIFSAADGDNNAVSCRPINGNLSTGDWNSGLLIPGHYHREAHSWISSWVCTLIGMVAITSSEVNIKYIFYNQKEITTNANERHKSEQVPPSHR